MRGTRNRWITSTVASMAVLGMVAGCGSGSDGGGESGGGGGGASGEVSGTLEIQYFVGGYGDAWWKAAIEDFEKEYPDVTVEEHAGPNINKTMQTRWISGNPPDVVYIDGAGISETQMVEDEQLMDLTDWVKDVDLPDGTALADSFIVPPSTYDGKIHSLPLIVDAWGTWYDQAWFEENGWEAPQDFPSWMDSMGQIQQDASIAPFTVTGQYPYYFSRGVLYPAFASVGGDKLLNAVINGEEGVWKSDGVMEVMTRVKEMVDAGYVDPGFAGISHTQSQSDFLQHQNAYIPVGLWLPKEMSEDTPEGFEYGFIPTPMNAEGEEQVLVPDLRPVAIAEQAENPEAAKAFVEFIFQKKYAEQLSVLSGALSNRKGVDLSSNPDVPGYLKQANELLNSGDVALHNKKHPMSSKMELPIGDALVKFLLGETSVEQFTDKAASIAEDYRSSN